MTLDNQLERMKIKVEIMTVLMILSMYSLKQKWFWTILREASISYCDSWFHLMSCSWSLIDFDLFIYMVQFLFGSEIIFQITSRFGLAKLENEGGALKNKV